MNSPLLSWAEIDLDAATANVRALKQLVGKDLIFAAVVKANAYGHGAVEIADVALQHGADWIIVNRSIEGVELRRANITAPIFVLGHTMPQEADRMVRWDLRPTLTNLVQAKAYSKAARKYGKEVCVHLKIDTGMGRLGVFPPQAVEFARDVSKLPGLVIEGVYSHPSVADEATEDDIAYTRMQFERLVQTRDDLAQAGFEIPICHFCNSAATVKFPDMHHGMVRCGMALYGFDPFIGQEGEGAVTLQPVLSLKSHLARVEVQPQGSAVSYGRTYMTSAPTKIAVVPVGYGDGYRRALSNKGAVLVRGQRAPIVGRVCMDQFMVDVTHIPDVELYDEAVLIGAQGDERIISEDIARLIDTHVDEVTSALLPRIPRVYLRDRQMVKSQELAGTRPTKRRSGRGPHRTGCEPGGPPPDGR